MITTAILKVWSRDNWGPSSLKGLPKAKIIFKIIIKRSYLPFPLLFSVFSMGFYMMCDTATDLMEKLIAVQ